MSKAIADLSRGGIAAAAFGPVLRRLRNEASHTQTTLSVASGVDRTFISQLERGIRQPSLAVFIDLARTLELDPARLMTLTLREMRDRRRS